MLKPFDLAKNQYKYEKDLLIIADLLVLVNHLKKLAKKLMAC